jgi:hypothetical protein
LEKSITTIVVATLASTRNTRIADWPPANIDAMYVQPAGMREEGQRLQDDAPRRESNEGSTPSFNSE